MLPQKKF